ncbi:YHYH domain-containing protein [Pseudomonas aeruginosa]|uniref:YHYH domain-containing protein n=1 Tax=Pseudomonas aeruginosa TaxID=287 RepID=UPI003EDED79E
MEYRWIINRTGTLPDGRTPDLTITLKILSLVIAAVLSLSSVAAFAHSGGTDSKGCHTNHKTGERHCH